MRPSEVIEIARRAGGILSAAELIQSGARWEDLYQLRDSGELTELSRGVRALYDDLGERVEDVVVLTMSEFGRTVAENGSGGTDHGHANCMLVLGGNVSGGRIYGEWPGLEKEQLYEGRDLALTTDFRDVFGEVAANHLGASGLERVFPGFEVDRGRFLGVVAS